MKCQEVLNLLINQFKNEKWFYTADTDEYGRCVVYAHWIDADVQGSVPHSLNGKRVLLHFADNKKACREKYVINVNNKKSFLSEQQVKEEDTLDLDELISKLDILEMSYGFNVLETIFYETHDQKNAITNLSIKFPQVRKEIDQLYQTYGFDLIYENLGVSQ